MTRGPLTEYQEAREMARVAEGIALYPATDAPRWLLIVIVVLIFLALPFLPAIDDEIDAWLASRPTLTAQETP